MIDIKTIAEHDRASVLHPFTQLKDFASGKLGDPIIITGGKGIRIEDATGHRYIDGFAGLYCVNIGYGRTEVAEAIARQAYKLAYYHTYAAHSTEELASLSDRLVRMAPGKPSKVFFGLSGSDANETQAKLVWYYNNLRGQPNKKKIISRERGYHGCSVISGSMTGMSFYHNHMNLPFPGILHTGAPHYYWGAVPGETEDSFSRRRAAELEELILREGPETIGALLLSRCSARAVSRRLRRATGVKSRLCSNDMTCFLSLTKSFVDSAEPALTSVAHYTGSIPTS